MKRMTLKLIPAVLWVAVFLLSSCTPAYKVTKTEGTMVAIDSTWDVNPDSEAMALLAPYKAKVDSIMLRVVGTAEVSMDKGAPESLLSNLVADVLRNAAGKVLGKPADMGLINMGGLRNVLTEGPITCMKGVYLKELFNNIAACHGQGVSGMQLLITKDGKLLEGTVAGRPIEDEQLYTIATIDYLADGNDGMTALPQAEKRECPDGATLRGLFMDYVEQQTAAGKKITSRMEGRITVKDE